MQPSSVETHLHTFQSDASSVKYSLYINPTISPRFTRAFPPIPSLLGTERIRSVVSLTTAPWLGADGPGRLELSYEVKENRSKSPTSLLWSVDTRHPAGKIRHRIFGNQSYTDVHISESVGISKYLRKG